MPTYQYRHGDSVIERVLPVDRRDDYPGRITVPVRVVVRGHARNHNSFGHQISRGLRGVEDAGQLLQMQSEGGWSSGQLKRIWHDELQEAK